MQNYLYIYTHNIGFVERKNAIHILFTLYKKLISFLLIPLTNHGHLRQNKTLKNIVKRPQITKDRSGSYC